MMPPKFRFPKRFRKPALVLGLVLVCLLCFRPQLVSILTLVKDQQVISSYLESIGPIGPLVLFLLLVAQVFVAVIPGHALMMAGGYLFGPVVAISIVACSTILGSEIAFWLARCFGRKLVDRLVKIGELQRWQSLADRQGALFYFFVFVLPIFPSDLMCYVAGLGKVSPFKFLVANICGRTICAVAITLVGVFGFNPPWQFWVVILVCLFGFLSAWRICGKLRRLYVQ